MLNAHPPEENGAFEKKALVQAKQHELERALTTPYQNNSQSEVAPRTWLVNDD